ncbi:MAG: hypothetical protein GY720_08090 [bacterium]|nr:hypothetical protein [bacterium]
MVTRRAFRRVAGLIAVGVLAVGLATPVVLAQESSDTGEFQGSIDIAEALETQGVLAAFEEVTENAVAISRKGESYVADIVFAYKWSHPPEACDEAFGTYRYLFSGTASASPDTSTLVFEGTRTHDFEAFGPCGSNSFEETPFTLRFELVEDVIVGNFFPGTFEAFLVSGTAQAGDADCSDRSEGREHGVIERDCKLFLVAPPGETLSISRSDLPNWAREQVVTVGAIIVKVGVPTRVSSGDPTVLIDGKPVAMLGSQAADGGVVVEASERIFVNGVPVPTIGSMVVSPMNTVLVPHVGGPIVTNGSAATIEQICDLRGGFCEALTMAADSGATSLDVDMPKAAVGDVVLIDGPGGQIEAARVTGQGSLLLEEPLAFAHPAGSIVALVPAELRQIVDAGPSAEQIAAFEAFVSGETEESPLPVLPILAVVGLAVLGASLVLIRRRRSSAG